MIAYSRRHLAELWERVGESPQDFLLFCAENGAGLLERHFHPVERRDVSGTARFPTVDAIVRFLGSYGEFADPATQWQVQDLATPFEATYRHSVFVAQSGTSEATSPRR